MPGDPVHVLLAIQREYFVRLAELLPALPTIFQEVSELKRLSREQSELVIRRSLGRFRVRFDELVTTHLVDDLSTAEGVLPVELQICCDVLFQHLEEGERTVEYDIYRRIGPARRILDGLLESRLRTFRWRRHTLAKAALVNCVTATRTKALVRVDECALDIGADREVTEELMEELVGLGLLRRLSGEDGYLYELRHEYLAQSLGPWLSDVEGEAKDVDDLLHRELNNFQRFQMLLDKEKLRLIHQYRRRLTLTSDELDLLIRSAAQERYEVEYWLARVNELTVSQQMVLCVDLLYSPEPDLRDALRLMISRLDHQAVLPTLLDSLREADPVVRETAIEVLREIDQNLVAALQPGDVARQQQAAYALGQIGARHAVPELVETARHGAAEVREQAVEALAELDRSRSADLLLRSLRSGSRGSRWNAALALGRLGRDSGVRERIQREAERPEAPESVVYAYARACLEGRQLDDADRVLRILDKRAVPDDQRQHLVDTWEELEALRRQEQRGLLAWSMYRGSPGGSAYTTAGLRLPLALKWEFATGDRVLSSPAVANGVVYIGSTDKSLYALDADSGAAHWTIPTEAELHSTPCVVGGRVFIGGMDGMVHAVEAESGRPLWSRRFGEAVSSSIRGTEESLFVGTSDGGVFAFSPEDGRVQWEYRLRGSVDASPAMDGGLVTVGTREEGLVVLDKASGAERWRWRVMGGMAGSPAVVDGRILVGSGDGRVEVLDTDGVLIWSALLDSAAGSSPALAQGRVFVGGVDGEIAAFRLTTGERLWTFRTEGAVSASPTVAGKAVFVGSHGGQLFALDAGSGRPLWRYRTGYSIHSTPAVADGRLFVALRYYNVCAFAEPVEVEDMR
ncbi:MAG: PQQ-binding-like beta-propeller repeat protein [Armatimonadetes bacterium]|nr:PQQ-binding-like beta-propeller repeat protein [Armatimonadota bacterium]